EERGRGAVRIGRAQETQRAGAAPAAAAEVEPAQRRRRTIAEPLRHARGGADRGAAEQVDGAIGEPHLHGSPTSAAGGGAPRNDSPIRNTWRSEARRARR